MKDGNEHEGKNRKEEGVSGDKTNVVSTTLPGYQGIDLEFCDPEIEGQSEVLNICRT